MKKISQVIPFKEMLDQLPYITIGQKIIACTLYIASDLQTKLELEKFYKDQLRQVKELKNAPTNKL